MNARPVVFVDTSIQIQRFIGAKELHSLALYLAAHPRAIKDQARVERFWLLFAKIHARLWVNRRAGR